MGKGRVSGGGIIGETVEKLGNMTIGSGRGRPSPTPMKAGMANGRSDLFSRRLYWHIYPFG